jgi:hypothetical protein
MRFLRHRILRGLDPKARRQVLQVLDTLIEAEQLKQKVGQEEARN